MNKQFEQQRVASVVKRNLQKFKILVGDKEKKFNDLLTPFTKLDTFIDAKSILKSIVKPSNKILDPLTTCEIQKQQYQRSTFVNGDYNSDNFYEDVDQLINHLEKEQSEMITVGTKKISKSEILEFKSKHPNYELVSKQFAEKSKRMIANLNRQSTRIFNKKYSLIHLSPRQSISNQYIALGSERDPSSSKYSHSKLLQGLELKAQKSQFKIKTEPTSQRNYNQKIQQLINDIEGVHKQMIDETDQLQKKTSRFILNQSKSNSKIPQFDYLATDTNFAFTKIKKRII
ncbi:unnamed protein product [Paramecium octaurelia]|uniref:Uncharacterized protein n=1 Tax=Paramecium octaurelia TaxID=43137 RepID=A0A8S1SIT6_PAROT|nr:unnamed protein product [Paramecium octaurelia]